MSNDTGTLGVIVNELATLASPLRDHLKPENAATFFARLGIVLSPAQVASISGPANATASSVIALIQVASEIVTATSTVVIAAKTTAGIAAVATFINSLNPLGAAIGGLGLPGVDASKIPERMFNVLMEGYLNRITGLKEGAEFVGLLTSESPAHPEIPAFDFGVINRWMSSPKQEMINRFQWGDAGFNGKQLLTAVQTLVTGFGLPSLYDDPTTTLDLFLLEIKPKTDVNPKGILITVKSEVSTGAQQYAKDDWKIEAKADASFFANTTILIQPDGNVTVTAPSGSPPVQGDLTVKWTGRKPSSTFVILGEAGASRIEVEELSVTVTVSLASSAASTTGAFRIEGAVKGCKVVIDTSKGDGFLLKLLPIPKAEADFDLLMGVSSDKGFFFNGSSALEIQLPLHIGLGPVSLEGLTIGIKPQGGAIPITLGADIKGELGPLVAVVQNMGITGTLTFPAGNGGNLGPVNLALGFKPPTGVGLSVDVGIIKGGGFLSIDVEKGEYVGAMELDFVGIISLKAIAIINTKMPDGSSGFSLLIIITADFPPIQLGFGFTLNAVGGLLGLNRTVNMDALREGVRTNAIKSILFPQDVVANITRIVSDLKQIFPPLNERFVVGPMAKLGWGTPSIITLELGILIELPVPRIAILGVLKAFLPAAELALLRIQVNFLGVLDFENQYISFDASLFDSRLLIYTLTGDMAFRLSWGDNPMFVLSVGGFHPAYRDAPQDLRSMKRLGISLLGGDNPRISVMSYFAVTSNTVQFGARAELYAEAAGFNVYGFIGYDVLFQFDPFKFIASFEAGLALREGSSTIMGIHLAGELSGINPWNARGDASISILFFEISVSFNETWGDDATKVEPAREDILARLVTEINDNRNWKADIPSGDNLHVSIRKVELPPDQLVIHPMGVLTFSERLVPLDLEISKFGNKVPLDARKFEIKATDAGVLTEKVTEEFAPANFLTKNDNEKLSSPSFDRMTSGFKVTGANALVMPATVNKSVDYELTYLHKKRTQRTRKAKYAVAKHAFKASTKAAAVGVSALSYAKNRISVNAPEVVALDPPQFGIANVSDMRLAGPDLVATSYTEASQKYSALIARRPELKDQVQILAHHELNDD
ncbi:MAG: hypothetical protein H7Z40_13975 [Phycisphaerae bacterium]|nr:hypothetical protein [Gemmatimonadaceae bacterium]